LDRNLLIAFVLSTLIFVGWMTYQQQVVLPQRRAVAERATAEAEARGETTALAEAAQAPVKPGQALDIVKDTHATPPPSPGIPRGDDSGARPVPEWSGTLENEAVLATFSNRGGVITGWQLKGWFESPRQEVPVELVDLPDGVPTTLSTPLVELGLGDLSNAMYEVEESGEERIVFALRRGGVVVRKTYEQLDEQFQIQLAIEITNQTDRILSPRFELVVPGVANDREDWKELSLIARANSDVTRELVQSLGTPGFMGGLFGGWEGPITLSAVQWGGIDVRYFAKLVWPVDADGSGLTMDVLEPGKVGFVRLEGRPVEISPRASQARRYTAFFGPKQPALLDALGNDLDQAVSRGYSWVAPLTGFFGWALHRVHDFVPNYGLAIIVLTILVRMATWPIMARQMKSAERMRELMPRIKELQEKYKDDRQKQSEETFKLYRETGVNPLGGCLPMVLQLPVFIGLFYALQSSIDLRHAPFFLWINDLSAPATLFTLPGLDFPVRILPVLMGASMFIQQKMMPQTGMDPAQAKMMLIMMPGMMLVISYTFPSGLVLYWMVSNVLGIAHQLYVRSRMQAESS
jgi:YidC/Oxa1 family membrane protein insertase